MKSSALHTILAGHAAEIISAVGPGLILIAHRTCVGLPIACDVRRLSRADDMQQKSFIQIRQTTLFGK